MKQTYNEFIQNILDTRGRFACDEEYHERHHITPKCCGGTNDEENLIDLYAREHFIAHKLLALENPDNKGLTHAWICMAFPNREYQQRYELTPEEYENARIALSIAMSGENNPNYGKQTWIKGKHWSEEVRAKMSESRKGKYIGENNPMFGKPSANKGKHLSKETREKQSESGKHAWTEERRQKQSGKNNPMFGKKHTDESRVKQSVAIKVSWTKERREEQSKIMSETRIGENNPMWGKYHSEETREKISKSCHGISAGEKNPRAKQVVRLCDCKIYSCGKYAAEENKIKYQIFARKCRQHDEFMYYDEWLTLQNDFKDKERSNGF